MISEAGMRRVSIPCPASQGITRFIANGLFITVVDQAVNLDGQFGFGAVEIENIGSDRMLSTEADAGVADSQPGPDGGLWWCQFAAQLARKGYLGFVPHTHGGK